jgi:hypothetical protein
MINQEKNSLSISKVVKGTLLIDNTDGSFLSTDPDALDVIRGLSESFELIVDGMSSFDSGLSVEFSRVGNLEENVLHDIGAVWSLEFKCFALWIITNDHMVSRIRLRKL